MTVETEVQAADSAATNDEFEDAFAEFANAREVDAPPAAEVPQSEEDASEDVVEQPEAEQQPAVAVDPKLEAAEKRAQDLEHRLKSDAGRQAALQKKVQELQTQLEAGPKAGETKREHSAKMTQLMTDFPEIAEAVQEELEARIGKVQNEFQATVKPLREETARKEMDSAETEVKKVYPDFVKTVNSPEFLDWFHKQPAPVQALAGSKDPADAVAMLSYYGAPKAQAAPVPNAEVQEIKARRDAALQRNVSVRNTAPAPLADAPDSFDDAFAFFAKKREKQNDKRF